MRRGHLITVALLFACSKPQGATDVIETFEVGRNAFGPTIVDCRNGDSALAASAWKELSSALAKDQAPTLENVEIHPAKFQDSTGSVVRISYSFKPGDPGVVTSERDTLLVSDTCEALLWPGE